MSTLPEDAHRGPAGGLPHQTDRAGWGSQDPAVWTDEDQTNADAVRQLNATPGKVLDITEGEADELAAWASRQGWAVDSRWADPEGRQRLHAEDEDARSGRFENPPTLMQEFDQRGVEIERLRAMAVRAESQCAALIDALTEALAKRSHEFVSDPNDPNLCQYGDCTCGPAHPVHRTPAVVRAELEGRP